MNRRRQTHVLAFGLSACLIAQGAVAQSERVSVRMAPQPGQSVRLAMTQEMDFDIGFDGAMPPGFSGMKILTRTTMTMTQKTGPRKADGTVDAELTYEEFRAETLMNGQPMPAEPVDQIVGKTVSVTYARDGQIVSVKGLPAGGLTDDAFKEMMGSILGNLPAAPIGVGETATTPLNFAVPLPLPGAGPMQLSGENRIRLISIDKDNQGRSARFDSTVTGTMVNEMASPDGKGNLTFDFTMEGGGTTVLDLDRGLPRSALATTTLNGKITPNTVAPATSLPPMTMRATIRVTMTGK